MNQISEKYNIPVVEDACQSILGAIDGKNAGTWGKTGAFSLHPLKNINVWSDGGVIVTDDENLYKKLRLLRNHGFENRDTVVMMGCNSRLDTIQAVVGNWILPQAKSISDKRISNAKYLDNGLNEINEISSLGMNLIKEESEIDKIAKLIDESWKLKTKLDKNATHEIFYDIYEVALKSGALAGKLMGAGGGGFFYLIADPKYHQIIKSNLKKIKIWVPFKFSSNGSTIINKGNK